jgi:hypothetical protein
VKGGDGPIFSGSRIINSRGFLLTELHLSFIKDINLGVLVKAIYEETNYQKQK